MLDFTKTVINNLNQIKYLKNIDRITLEKKLDVDTNSPVKLEGSSLRIKELEGENRVNNLKICLKNYFFVRGTRFLMISMPALLTALAISTFFTPKRVERPGKATECTMEETIYSSNDGLCEKEPEKFYKLGDVADIFKHVIVDPKDAKPLKSTASLNGSIDVKIHNGEKSVTAEISLGSDGAMSIGGANVVNNYYDTDEYKDLVFREYEENEYNALFDRIVEMLMNSRYLSADGKKVLESLTQDEKREIILHIVKYDDIKPAEVIFSKTRLPRRIILTLISIIYWAVIGIFYYNNGLRVYDLENNDGKLCESACKRDAENLFYEALKVKEAFMAAERDRISNLKEEIDKNVANSDRNKILTRYERKLLSNAKYEHAYKDR